MESQENGVSNSAIHLDIGIPDDHLTSRKHPCPQPPHHFIAQTALEDKSWLYCMYDITAYCQMQYVQTYGRRDT